MRFLIDLLSIFAVPHITIQKDGHGGKGRTDVIDGGSRRMKDEQINPLDYFAAEIRQDRAAGHGAEALAGALGARYTLAAKTICRAAGAHYHQIATAEKVKGWAEAAALSISDFTTMAALDAEIAGAIREDIETYRENSGYYTQCHGTNCQTSICKPAKRRIGAERHDRKHPTLRF